MTPDLTRRQIAASLASSPIAEALDLKANVADLGGAVVFNSLGAVVAASIPNSVTTIHVLRHSPAHPYFPRYYRRVLSSPNHLGKVTSANGVIFELAPWQRIFPEMFGAFADGVADDTAAIQAANDFFAPAARIAPTTRAEACVGGGTVHFSNAWYRTTQPIYQNAYVRLQGSGDIFFPQQNYTGGDYLNAYLPVVGGRPNGTVIVADFPSGIRSYSWAIAAAPYVLQPITNQVVGTRFVANAASGGNNSIYSPTIDNGLISYCEGANCFDFTIVAVNEIFGGLRGLAATASRWRAVSVINCINPFAGESNWESTIEGIRANLFRGTGYWGRGNQLGIKIDTPWLFSGKYNRNQDKNVGIKLEYADAVTILSPSLDNLDTPLWFQNSSAITATGVHVERARNVMVRAQGCDGVYVKLGAITPVLPNADGSDTANTVLFDGNGFANVVLDAELDHPAYQPSSAATYGSGATVLNLTNVSDFTIGAPVSGPFIPAGATITAKFYPGTGMAGTITISTPTTGAGSGVTVTAQGYYYEQRHFRTDTNPTNNLPYDMSYAGRKGLTIVGRKPQPAEVGIAVDHTEGLIQFIDKQGNAHLVPTSNGIAVGRGLALTGSRSRARQDKSVNGVLTEYADVGSVSEYRCKPDGTIVFGYTQQGGGSGLDNGTYIGVYIGPIFLGYGYGSPEHYCTAQPGSMVFDQATGNAYIKKSGTGKTGWKAVTTAA